MGISFPNGARSFDDKNRFVRFTGYDGMFEIKILSGDRSPCLREISPECHGR